MPERAVNQRQLANLLIERRLQLRHIGVVSLISAALSALLGWLIWLQRSQASKAIVRGLDSADYLDADAKREIIAHLQGSDASVVLLMAGVCLGMITVIGVFMIVMTHKIAGPLHHVAESVDALCRGRLPLVHEHRRGDELKQFTSKFKRMCDVLRQRAEDDLTVYRGFIGACEAAGVELPLTGLRKRKEELERALVAGGH